MWFSAIALLALAGMFGTWLATSNTYELRASVLLLAQAPDKTTHDNPYLAFDASLRVTGDVIARSESTQTKQALLAAANEFFDRYKQCPEKILSVIGSKAKKVV